MESTFHTENCIQEEEGRKEGGREVATQFTSFSTGRAALLCALANPFGRGLMFSQQVSSAQATHINPTCPPLAAHTAEQSHPIR